MSRRAIVLVIGVFAALVIANVVVLTLWLPSRKSTAKNETANVNSAAGSAAATSVPMGGTQPNDVAAGFAVERQVVSASGNVKIKYLRNRNTKMRAIAVEDARQPKGGAVLYQSKSSAWALVSPDDQWIVIEERGSSGSGNLQLYHRNNDAGGQYRLIQDNSGSGLQDAVWSAYLNDTQADPTTLRQGVTIDATAWENDSRKLHLAVVYIPRPNNPDVPAPWSCTYDVASKKVEPVSAPAENQPDDGTGVAQQQQQQEAPQQQGSEQPAASNNPFADNATESPAENAEDNELPGEKFPATRLDELAIADVNESSLDEINYAINEMYARHGADFKDKKVAKQFSEFDWYKPQPGLTFDNAEKEFSDLETQNLKVLKQCRDVKLAAARRKSRPARGERAQEEGTGEKILRGIRTWQDMGGPMPPHP